MQLQVSNMNSKSTTRIAIAISTVLGFLCFLGQPSIAQTSGGSASSQYILHPNDVLLITVMGHDDYSKSETVLSDGTFDYPVVGIVHAAGKSVNQLTNLLEKGLSTELDSPQVSISITTAYTPSVSVVGAVAKPGTLTYVTDWHVLDAIASAGGVVDGSQSVDITVVRPGSNPISVDAPKLFSGIDPTQNPLLMPGDTVLVQPKDSSELTVQISGDVKTPGSFPVPPSGESPLAALTAAGGPNDDAYLKEVHVLHNGVVSNVDLVGATDSLEGAATLPSVLPGDVIVVSKNPNRIDVLGAVLDPAVYALPEDKAITASQAMSLAGGPNSAADLRKVTLLRVVNGQPVVHQLDIGKIYRGGDQSANIIVQEGDVIYVPSKDQPNNIPLLLAGPLISLANLLK